jgi:site-specific recombinase XerC
MQCSFLGLRVEGLSVGDRSFDHDSAAKHTKHFALRHYYASLLISEAASVKTVQARLGHASATETLNTYAHLWPDSEDHTRAAIEGILGSPRDARGIESRA